MPLGCAGGTTKAPFLQHWLRGASHCMDQGMQRTVSHEFAADASEACAGMRCQRWCSRLSSQAHPPPPPSSRQSGACVCVCVASSDALARSRRPLRCHMASCFCFCVRAWCVVSCGRPLSRASAPRCVLTPGMSTRPPTDRCARCGLRASVVDRSETRIPHRIVHARPLVSFM